MAFSLKVPLPGVIADAFAALFLKISGIEDAAVKAADAAYPGAGAVVKQAIDKYQPQVAAAVDVLAVVTKAGVELGDAVKTLHAFAKPDPTDSA